MMLVRIMWSLAGSVFTVIPFGTSIVSEGDFLLESSSELNSSSISSTKSIVAIARPVFCVFLSVMMSLITLSAWMTRSSIALMYLWISFRSSECCMTETMAEMVVRGDLRSWDDRYRNVSS